MVKSVSWNSTSWRRSPSEISGCDITCSNRTMQGGATTCNVERSARAVPPQLVRSLALSRKNCQWPKKNRKFSFQLCFQFFLRIIFSWNINKKWQNCGFFQISDYPRSQRAVYVALNLPVKTVGGPSMKWILRSPNLVLGVFAHGKLLRLKKLNFQISNIFFSSFPWQRIQRSNWWKLIRGLI